MMNEPKLLRAKRDDVLDAVKFGLGFSRGRASNGARDLGLTTLARMVVEHLEMSGYVVMREPPAPAHTTSGGARLPMKD